MQSHFDHIIVGQGIAGTILHFLLNKKSSQSLVVDPANNSAASLVAGGLLNPLTGKRFVKALRAEETFAAAKKLYKQVEQEFNISIYSEMNIWRVFLNEEQRDKYWKKQSEKPEISKYWNKQPAQKFPPGIKAPFDSVEITGAARVDMNSLIKACRKRLQETGQLLQEQFDYGQCTITEEGVSYKNFTAKSIIFAEGYGAIHNPWLVDVLPFIPAKGEVLTIKCPELELQQPVIKRKGVAPIGNGMFKVGATYAWEEMDNHPTDAARQELVKGAEDLLEYPFRVIGQVAGVRPIVKDRRPVIGRVPGFQNAFVINGLGTKGASLAPLFAQMLVNFFSGEAIDAEVDVARLIR